MRPSLPTGHFAAVGGFCYLYEAGDRNIQPLRGDSLQKSHNHLAHSAVVQAAAVVVHNLRAKFDVVAAGYIVELVGKPGEIEATWSSGTDTS